VGLRSSVDPFPAAHKQVVAAICRSDGQSYKLHAKNSHVAKHVRVSYGRGIRCHRNVHNGKHTTQKVSHLSEATESPQNDDVRFHCAVVRCPRATLQYIKAAIVAILR